MAAMLTKDQLENVQQTLFSVLLCPETRKLDIYKNAISPVLGREFT